MSDWLAQITLYGVDGDAEAPDGRDAHLALAAVRSRLPFIWCSVEAATADAIGSFRFNYGPVVSRPSNWLSTSRKINMQIDWKFGRKSETKHFDTIKTSEIYWNSNMNIGGLLMSRFDGWRDGPLLLLMVHMCTQWNIFSLVACSPLFFSCRLFRPFCDLLISR